MAFAFLLRVEAVRSTSLELRDKSESVTTNTASHNNNLR